MELHLSEVTRIRIRVALSYRDKFRGNFDDWKGNSVQVSEELELSTSSS